VAILIVDDETDIRETLEDFLTDEGFAVRSVADGAAALRVLGDPELPCVVILDLIMPVLDGNEVIEAMKKDERLCNVPVIITTSDPARAPHGIALMKKPVSLPSLLAAVERLCIRAGAGGTTVAGT
jgi:DNA-binding response OmpR family regulator